ncbi:hypothetical protein [Fusibacter tunisiensis]|uniref:Outer membrane lipoprotein-sorting protein n=1 Tax=Fusibacter tunisiensis TaxID=1008308 RepID=A0ABS2MNG2_9FIRM|nr:hypothetical protein [Fusibacter tunisiensis]MBM7560932.1 outer membrane lipoprotein-sorting protein [Fusibacter tunisiensis]
MKKVIFMVLVFVLVFAITGCGDSGDTEPEATVSESAAGGAQAEATTEANAPQETTEASQGEKIDLSSKKGQELLDALSVRTLDKLYFKGTSYAEGMTIETITYIYKDNYRTESKSDMGEQVAIYNADEGALYSYSVTDGAGMIFYDDDEMDMEDDEDEEYVEADITLGEELFTDLGGMLVDAELTELNGYEVVYIESSTSTGEGEWLTRQWISTEYWYPLKFESVFNGAVIGGYDVDEISSDFEVTEDLFTPPDDIEFMDLDDMFNMDFYDEYDEDEEETP